ncbi:LysR family transcriptional regulator [Pigmentiphaga litoralis]|uniref:LysR family transcriptional regulator n=1 Tax=Pigmentiphaga litoralis TaxID=516702 RepID=UPI00167404D6|nr:LysR family transcriptional regulator [Pigmentiphaga litoralis]GGX02001.1 LysR family transcriptional regulator [Pigmentiphaga litoralis]
MTKIDMTDMDLNLLTAFQALMQDRNVTRAGLRLGLSQSSMSHALTRLRKLTGDPLFVRLPGGMEPTPYALQIDAPIREGLALMQAGLNRVTHFEPATTDRTFQLLLSDIGELVYLPQLIVRLSQIAPGANLRVLQLPRESYRNAFIAGNADLAMGFLPSLQAGFYQQRLFDDSYVCLARSAHPRVGKRLTLKQFAAESHVLIEPAGSRYSHASAQHSTTSLIERYLASKGMKRRIALRVPHFMVVPSIVQQTDLLAIVPSYVMTYMKPMPGLKTLPLPIDVPRFEVKQFWHERSHHDPANQWLRKVVAELFLQ